MSDEQANIAQHTLTPLRRMDAKLDDVLSRLSMLERNADVAVPPRSCRIETRLDLTDPSLPPAA